MQTSACPEGSLLSQPGVVGVATKLPGSTWNAAEGEVCAFWVAPSRRGVAVPHPSPSALTAVWGRAPGGGAVGRKGPGTRKTPSQHLDLELLMCNYYVSVRGRGCISHFYAGFLCWPTNLWYKW